MHTRYPAVPYDPTIVPIYRVHYGCNDYKARYDKDVVKGRKIWEYMVQNSVPFAVLPPDHVEKVNLFRSNNPCED